MTRPIASPSLPASPTPPDAPRWPDARRGLGEEYAREWTRRAKYALRSWITTSSRRRVMAHVAGSPAAQALLAHTPRAFCPLLNKHIDRRFGARERADALVHSMRGLEQAIGPAAFERIARGETLTLATLPDATRVVLTLNRLTFDEGLWAIDLERVAGQRLYTISFGWLDAATLAIACVQGPPREVDGLACVRELTDAAHGLRPAHLLMHLLRACAAAWGVERIVGIDEPFQVKGRWNHRAKARMFDYDTFWNEVGGRVGPDRNWHFDVAVPQRLLEDVPSKRRAMYRRRYALLADLERTLAEAFAGAA